MTGFSLSNGTCQLENSCEQSSCRLCSENKCTLCLNSFVLNNSTNECMLCPKNCDKCSLDKKCLRCIANYFITIEGNCEESLLVCYRPIGYLKCLECYEGEYMANFGCYRCISYCGYCTNQSNCEVCLRGYFLTTNTNGSVQCNPCSNKCSSNCYGDAHNCTLCPPSEIAIQGVCTYCFILLPYCVICQLNETSNLPFCTNCIVGMFASEEGCMRCERGCDICFNESTCENCSTMFYLTGEGLCEPCLIENCINCTNNSVCIHCSYYFYLSPNQSQCLACPPGCVVCSSYSECNVVLEGHSIFNGIVITCDAICLTCLNSSSNCQACYDGFFITADSDFTQTCEICPEYCISCTQPNICQICRGGTYLKKGVCFSCPVNNCFDCNQTNSTNLCTLCKTGFYLSEENQCIECSEGCESCLNITACLLCLNGYYKENGLCVTCSTGCSICNNTACLLCADGYYGQGQLQECFSCPIGCRSCSSESICYLCSPGFFLAVPSAPAPSLPLCYPCIYPCLICSSNSTCATCEIGFEINEQGGCDRCPENFMVCSRGIGYFCFPGNFLDVIVVNGSYKLQCLVCPENCLVCRQQNSSSLFCQKCMSGLILSASGVCVECDSMIENCLECDQNGNCNACLPGLELQNDECVTKEPESEFSWSLIGANIALGCLAIILLIAILIQSNKKSIRPSSINIELIDEK